MLVARNLAQAEERLRSELGLGEPFRDPGVGEFGLANAVFAVGDCFLEVVSPTGEGTAAGRQLERAGDDGGYMVLFDLEDLGAARERARELGVRTVWQIDLPDISGTHMHPADLRGAIVSLDRSEPYGTWRWGGPEWTGRRGSGAPARLAGVTLAVEEPREAAARWAQVLGLAVAGDGGTTLETTDGATVRFREAAGAAEALVEIELAVPAPIRAGREALDFGAARIVLSDL